MSLIKILKDNIFLVFVIVVPIMLTILSARISCLSTENNTLTRELEDCRESKAILEVEIALRAKEMTIIEKSIKSQEAVKVVVTEVKEFIENESVQEGEVSDWLDLPIPNDLLCKLNFLCNTDQGSSKKH